MGKKSIYIVAAIAANVLVAANANAVLTSWGPQTFNETGVGNFDTVAVYGAGTTLVDPLANLSSPWTVYTGTVNGSYYESTWAHGAATTNLNMDISGAYDTTSNPPIEFYFYAWEGQTLKEKAHAWYTGQWGQGSWQFDGNAPDRDNPYSPVPEPFTMILGAASLAVAAIRKRRA